MSEQRNTPKEIAEVVLAFEAGAKIELRRLDGGQWCDDLSFVDIG